jgi:hypothetical protein
MLNGLAVTLVVTNIFSGIGVRMIRPSPIEPSVNWAQPGRGTGISVTQSGSSEICHSMGQRVQIPAKRWAPFRNQVFTESLGLKLWED